MSLDPSPPGTDPPSALPRGTRLGEFELLRVLGIGGFGIVYLAFDHALEREVAVKEYMPASLAGRTETMHVSLRSQSDADTFSLGLKSFVNEARLLARFDHPSLVKVHRFWEANGTAYMAMPVLRGSTLKELRKAMDTPPGEAWLRGLLDPLLGAIERLHGEGVYHRDIAPDNIQIEADGRPVLLDFGAARRVIGDKSQALTAILKPAYAPIEQYGEAGSVRQGPWTDLYALGATLHFMLLGRPPAPATARAVHDDMTPLSAQAQPGCSADFLRTIDWMLAPRPVDRPQSVAALREVLAGRVSPPVRRPVPAEPVADWESTRILGAAPKTGAPAAVAQTADDDDPGTMIVPPRGAVGRPPTAPAPAPAPAPARSSAPAPEASAFALPLPAPADSPRLPTGAATGSKLLATLGVAAAFVLAAAVWFFLPKADVLPAGGSDVAAAPNLPASAAISSEPPLPSLPSSSAASVASAAATPLATATAPVVTPPPASTAPARPSPAGAATPRPAAVRPQAEVAAPPIPVPRQEATESSAGVVPPVAAVSAASPARISGPKERCGDRVLLSLWACIERQCTKPDLLSHPECVKLRAEQEQRVNPTR